MTPIEASNRGFRQGRERVNRMKGSLSSVFAIMVMMMLVETQHCRSSSEADSWDVAINSEMNRTTSYYCSGSIHECIAPEADLVVDHTFRRVLAADGMQLTPGILKPNPVCPDTKSYGGCSKPQVAIPGNDPCNRVDGASFNRQCSNI